MIHPATEIVAKHGWLLLVLFAADAESCAFCCLLIDVNWPVTLGYVLPPQASGDIPSQILYVSKVT